MGSSLNKGLDHFRPMCWETIPDNNRGAVKLPQQMAKKLSYQLRIDIGIRMKAKIEVELGSTWGNAQGCDNRDFSMRTGALIKNRCLPLGTPSASDQRGHQHTGFVDKDKESFQSRGFF